MVKAMGHWEAFEGQLKLVCNLIRRTFSRQRLMETCFSDPPASLHQHLYSSFSGTVGKGRWGVVWDAAEQLGPLEASLRFAWDGVKFNRGKPLGTHPQPADEDKVCARLRICDLDEAIQSAMFWRYRFMVTLLGDVVQHLFAWVQGCCCHACHELFLEEMQENTPNPTKSELLACPMHGRRAPEMAAGRFRAVLNEIWDIHEARLLVMEPAALTAEQRGVIFQDFCRGRQAFTFYVMLAAGVYEQFPLVLASLAHHKPTIAQAFALKLMSAYDGLTQEQRGALHPLVHLVLSPAGDCRRDVQFFASAGVVRPLLRRHQARLKFIRIIEREAESLHAKVSQGIRRAPNHGRFSFQRSPQPPNKQNNIINLFFQRLSRHTAVVTIDRLHVGCVDTGFVTELG